MSNAQKGIVTSRADIANVFADFYEQLYAASGDAATWQYLDASSDERDNYRPITPQELREQIRTMPLGKAPDEAQELKGIE